MCLQAVRSPPCHRYGCRFSFEKIVDDPSPKAKMLVPRESVNLPKYLRTCKYVRWGGESGIVVSGIVVRDLGECSEGSNIAERY